MSNDYKIIGTHTMRAGVPEDCTECHDAEWGGVLVNGVCGRCLYTAWKNAQQNRAGDQWDLPRKSSFVFTKATQNGLLKTGQTPMILYEILFIRRLKVYVQNCLSNSWKALAK
jgi:hypothetical protein